MTEAESTAGSTAATETGQVVAGENAAQSAEQVQQDTTITVPGATKLTDAIATLEGQAGQAKYGDFGNDPDALWKGYQDAVQQREVATKRHAEIQGLMDRRVNALDPETILKRASEIKGADFGKLDEDGFLAKAKELGLFAPAIERTDLEALIDKNLTDAGYTLWDVSKPELKAHRDAYMQAVNELELTPEQAARGHALWTKELGQAIAQFAADHGIDEQAADERINGEVNKLAASFGAPNALRILKAVEAGSQVVHPDVYKALSTTAAGAEFLYRHLQQGNGAYAQLNPQSAIGPKTITEISARIREINKLGAKLDNDPQLIGELNQLSEQKKLLKQQNIGAL